MTGTDQAAKRGPSLGAVLIALALGLVAYLLIAPSIASRVWHVLFFRPAVHYVDALIANPHAFDLVGNDTVFVGNAFLDKVIGLAPESTGVMAERLREGHLHSGQVAVLDLALWCQVTGLWRNRIPVLGSSQRLAGEKELDRVRRSWAAGEKVSGTVSSNGKRFLTPFLPARGGGKAACPFLPRRGRIAGRSRGSARGPGRRRPQGRRGMVRFAALVAGVLLGVATGQGAAKAPQAPAPGAPAAEAPPPAPLMKVPDPLAAENPAYPLVPMAMPEAGKPFTDPRFGTHLVRATESRGLRHEYSRHDPFNTGCSLVLLHRVEGGGWEVYRTASFPYDRKENLVRTVDLEEARWDPAAGDLLWGTREFRIETLNVRTGEVRIVKDFTKDPRVGPLLKAEKDLYRVTMKDEGETSLDKRYWALAVQGSADDYRLRHVVVWDRREDKVLGLRRLAREESDVDWVGMSPLGTWVLVGGMAENRAPLAGLVIADKALGEFHRIDQTTAHADVGLDAGGREVVVMQNTRTDHIDMIPLDPKTGPMLEGGAYEGTGRTPLVRLFYDSESPAGFGCGVHISCNTPGWAVVSTYMEPGRKEQNWLDRSIILVRLDARQPEAFYLAKVYSTCGAYWEETQATISADGSRVVWAADWDRDVGKERPVLMQLGMPAGWKALLK